MQCNLYRDYEIKTKVGESMQLLWYLSVGIVLWRAVSYGLPRSFKSENTSNEHGKPENGIINGRGHIWKLDESASVTIVGSSNLSWYSLTLFQNGAQLTTSKIFTS